MDTDVLPLPPTERELELEREIAERRRMAPRTPDEDDDVNWEAALADAPPIPETAGTVDGDAEGRDARASDDGDFGSALRSAAVTMGPSIALDALLGASAIGLAADALLRPSKSRAGGLLRGAAAVGSLAAWGYVLAVRPWQQAWGASERELRSTLPGDGIIPRPTSEATRAITIAAPASYIWPWIVQIGAGRGGFYSYDWLENLAGLEIHSADAILPHCQDLEVGDEVPFGKGVGIPVVRLDHERAMVLGASIDMASGLPYTPGGPEPQRFVAMTWAFVLRPVDETTTRFIVRFRLEQRPRGIVSSYYPLMIELPHFVMERRMLYGIRDRAERMFGNEPT